MILQGKDIGSRVPDSYHRELVCVTPWNTEHYREKYGSGLREQSRVRKRKGSKIYVGALEYSGSTILPCSVEVSPKAAMHQ
eukprot:CAMPEP_0184687706 /NCGR_PEP_ID=MMETSP0312-20130426/27338_1 /TAXON_ID=31354 /ORGANISM="Compsopogon coeruleus, Strain SAG 36.94" /LENGTH=80 /DNA_ID=CAMNT_0027144127 /DNA_START=99 /DNA_END=338 /DNA_ORIENTATION=-